ncbi:type II toxin-antitoxin system VapC family toxin [Pararhizobium antarcticum]|uniref:Ribonuclease VapC n=1 Tax=Pararhizobium antarcticum TaxID=1798805 RepID=A0A657LND3_9HYPH|nr:type II toxin-antitoxin system VapC family toxin [Pararhizobium antarcticum]OJF92899.1 twitching motility protein PilT [Pararhizobium antarcticum]OJF97741.1 twitching motility protein PilT [Rhizobium sp. 58]
MFVDASVSIGILTDEPESEAFARAMDAAPELVCSVLAVWEATVGLFRKKTMSMEDADARVQEFIQTAGIVVVPVADPERRLALRAFDLHGRHRFSDVERTRALNLADCFHYATAKYRGVAMLSKDAGFALTDVAIARVES